MLSLSCCGSCVDPLGNLWMWMGFSWTFPDFVGACFTPKAVSVPTFVGMILYPIKLEEK